MKIAQIKTSLTSAILQPDGSYVFGNCRPGRGQCGEYVNDTLNLQGVNRAGDTLASKCDAPDFKKVVNGGLPIPGAYFVMNTYLPYGHIGLCRTEIVINMKGENGFYFTDYNWDSHEGRRDGFIAVGDKNWKLIIGFGIGNPVIEFSTLTSLEEKTVIPTISAMYNALETLEPNDKRKKAKEYLHLANSSLRG